MGISGWIFKALKTAYPECMTKTIPMEYRQKRHISVRDSQDLIKMHPDYVNTVHLLKQYIVGQVISKMRRPDMPCPFFIVLFDRWTPDAKAIKTHTTRDKGVEPIAYDPGKPVLDESKPHEVLDILRPDQWQRYTTNRELVRRELYPIIWNAFIDEKYFKAEPGEQLILHGLPGQWRETRNNMYMGAVDMAPSVEVMCPRDRITPEHEKRDADIYNRVFMIRHGGLISEWKDAINDIGEADLAIVKYWQFFQGDNWMVFMDDGDALPIALLHTFDRIDPHVGLLNDQRKFYICKPRRGASGKELKRRAREKKLKDGKKLTESEQLDAEKLEAIERAKGKSWSRIEAERAKEYFIDVNALFRAIMNDPRLSKVQNPVVYLVAGIILTGTDYFGNGAGGASCLPGIGQERVIWPALFEHASEYSHMVQASLAHPPEPNAWREIVVDRDAVVAFFNACYLQVHESSIEEVRAKLEEREKKRIESLRQKLSKLRPSDGPDAAIKIQASMKKPRAQNQVPSEDDMRVMASHLFHNIIYWRNAWKRNYERYPDIFQRDDSGKSLWGYDHVTRNVANCVSQEMPFAVDEVYRRWLVRPEEIGCAPSLDAPRPYRMK